MVRESLGHPKDSHVLGVVPVSCLSHSPIGCPRDIQRTPTTRLSCMHCQTMQTLEPPNSVHPSNWVTNMQHCRTTVLNILGGLFVANVSHFRINTVKHMHTRCINMVYPIRLTLCAKSSIPCSTHPFIGISAPLIASAGIQRHENILYTTLYTVKNRNVVVTKSMLFQLNLGH